MINQTKDTKSFAYKLRIILPWIIIILSFLALVRSFSHTWSEEAFIAMLLFTITISVASLLGRKYRKPKSFSPLVYIVYISSCCLVLLGLRLSEVTNDAVWIVASTGAVFTILSYIEPLTTTGIETLTS